MHNSIGRRRWAWSWPAAVKSVMVLWPIGLLGYLLNSHYLFTPIVSYTYRPGQKITIVVPKDTSQVIRTAGPGFRWRIMTDTLSFKVNIPRLIETVRLRIRLDAGTTRLVTLNAAARLDGDYSTIVSSALLDTLDWPSVSDGKNTLWMRAGRISDRDVTSESMSGAVVNAAAPDDLPRQYSSMADFRIDPPPADHIAVAGLDRMSFSTVKNYRPRTEMISFPHNFRGSHQIYVYAANEELKLAFDKVDLNRKKGADTMSVAVARVDELHDGSRTWIKKMLIPDDGVVSAVNALGGKQLVEISLPNVSPGVYLVDIRASEDVIFSNLMSAQKNLAFNNRIFFADGPAYGTSSFIKSTISTNSSYLNFITAHNQGQQEIKIGRDTIKIKKPKSNVIARGLTGITTFDVAKGDLTIIGDNLITLAPAEIIPGGAHLIDLSGDPDVFSYDYIFVPYVPRQSGKIELTKTYPLSDLDLRDKTLTFSIDAPGMMAAGATLGLKDIRAELIRGPFPWRKIWEKATNFSSSLYPANEMQIDVYTWGG